jgi:osmotically-inducible protein OsmY
MRAPLLLAALAAAASTGGCVTMAVAGAAGVGVFAAQERTIGQGIDDAAASAELKARLLRIDSAAFSRVDVEVAQGKALMSGAVPTAEHRIEAERIAWTVRQVSDVANELEVGPTPGVWRSALDELITAQVRARILADPAVHGIDFNIETNKGTVYLMGLARDQAQLARAAEIASYTRGVKKVVSYVEVRKAPAGPQTVAQAEPAPVDIATPPQGN